MAERANVSSVDSIESFRASVIAYLAKARPVLEDASDEVSRTRQWLQTDRRMYWEGQLRRRSKILQEAEQAVFSARLSNLRETTTAEVAAVQRAKRAVQEAEEKLRLIKQWNLEFDHRVDPLVKQLESLRTMLGNIMPKGVAHLAQIVKTLDAYAGVVPNAPAPAATGPADESPKPGTESENAKESSL
jgi:hypothetical protein